MKKIFLVVKDTIELPYTANLRSADADGRKVPHVFNPGTEVDEDIAGLLLKTHAQVFYVPGSEEEKKALKAKPWKTKSTFKAETIVNVVKQLTEEKAAAVLQFANDLLTGKTAGAEKEKPAAAQNEAEAAADDMLDAEGPGKGKYSAKELKAIAKKNNVAIAKEDDAPAIIAKLAAAGVDV